MSDAHLRTLELRAASTPTPENQAEYLRARVRAGELPLAHLTLVAWLGHPGAQLASNASIPTDPSTQLPPSDDFVRVLQCAGWEALARSACALARYGLRESPWTDPWLSRIEAYVLAPSEDERDELSLLNMRELAEAHDPREYAQRFGVAHSWSLLIDVVFRTSTRTMLKPLEDLARAVGWPADHPSPNNHYGTSSLPALLVHVAAPTLLPWLLGARDPLQAQ